MCVCLCLHVWMRYHSTGLLPYAYLPWSALTQPQAGVWGDLATAGGFWHHFRRADYGTFKVRPSVCQYACASLSSGCIVVKASLCNDDC